MGDEKMFACLTPLSMQRMIEASGIDNLPNDITSSLAEDATYRLREVVCLSAQFMKRCRRNNLRSSDVSKALDLLNLPPVIGIEEGNQPQFDTVEDDTGTDVHFIRDDTVVLSKVKAKSTFKTEFVHPFISSEWIHLDGQEISDGKDKIISGTLQDYFSNIVSAIVGEDAVVRNEALQDLRKNSKIFPVLPYFVNFAQNVKAVSHDIEQLFMLLQTVRALVTNPNLTLLGYLKPLASSVLYCVLEPLTASINPVNDHWRLRDYGSRILSVLVANHGSKNHDFVEYICESANKIFLDSTRPLCSHYGAIVTVNALGIDKIQSIIVPNIKRYYHASLKLLLEENSDNNNMALKEDAYKVVGLLLHSLQTLFSKTYAMQNFPHAFLKLYNEMIEVFDDSLALHLQTFSKEVRYSRQEKSGDIMQTQPVFAKLPLHGNYFRSPDKSFVFAPLKLCKRNIPISIRRHQSKPPDPPVQYTHSSYFAMNLQLAFIGKSPSKCYRQRPRGYVDLCNIVI